MPSLFRTKLLCIVMISCRPLDFSMILPMSRGTPINQTLAGRRRLHCSAAQCRPDRQHRHRTGSTLPSESFEVVSARPPAVGSTTSPISSIDWRPRPAMGGKAGSPIM
jgi:hypothetical protein